MATDPNVPTPAADRTPIAKRQPRGKTKYNPARDDGRLLYTLGAAARLLGVSRVTLNIMIKRGEIAFQRVSTVRRISRKELERFADEGPR